MSAIFVKIPPQIRRTEASPGGYYLAIRAVSRVILECDQAAPVSGPADHSVANVIKPGDGGRSGRRNRRGQEIYGVHELSPGIGVREAGIFDIAGMNQR